MILIATATTDEEARCVERAELREGRPADSEPDRLVFPDVEGLYRVFTPKTLELIDVIRRVRPASITETAHAAGRDIKNVHTELHRLEELNIVSLIEEGRANRPVAEYDEIRLCISFDGRPTPRPVTPDEHQRPTRVEPAETPNTDAVFALDEVGRVTHVDERAVMLFGRPPEEVAGSGIEEVLSGTTGTTLETHHRKALRTRAVVTDELYWSPTENWFAVRLRPTEDGTTVSLRDVTDRKRREEQLETQRNELAALNHLNRLIQEITHAVIETSSPDRVERRVCDRIVESDLYAFAWVGNAEQGETEITWKHMAGGERSYREECRTSVERADPHGRGPTGTAIRTHEPQFVQDMRTDPDYEPWRSQATDRGFRASAAIPIVYDGILYSVLNVYATRPNVFTKPVREALGHLGQVIGHAIQAAEQRQALVGETVREIELRNERFAQRLIGSRSDVFLSVERTVPTDEDDVIHFMAVSGMSSAEFIESISQVPTVTSVTPLDEHGDGRLWFEVTITAPSLTGTLVSYGGRVRSVETTAAETRIVADLPPSAPIRDVVDAVDEVHPGTELIAQRTVNRDPKTTREIYGAVTERLTDKQRVALETAYFAGYFDWPRSKTGEELAEMLGITAPTFANHLRTAQRKLLEVLLSDGD